MSWDTAIEIGYAMDRWIRGLAPNWFFVNIWVELCTVATIYTCVILLFHRYFGCRRWLAQIRRDMSASVLQALLYRRSPRLIGRAQLRLVCQNFKLLVAISPTLLVGAALFGLLYPTLADRYEHAPAQVGRPLLIRTRSLGDSTDASSRLPHFTRSETAVQFEAFANSGDTTWSRVRSQQEGVFSFDIGEGTERGRFNVGRSDRPAHSLQYVGEVELKVHYPLRKGLGMNCGWFWWFLCVAVILPLVVARGRVFLRVAIK